MVFLRTLALSLVFVTAAAANDEPVVEIPLDQIWAAQMPGTRDVHTLDPRRFDPLIKSLVRPIRLSLNPEWQIESGKPQRPVAGTGFAVMGSGRIALEHAHKVLVEKKPPQKSFPAGSDISVVFFSYQAGTYVHLHQVERQGKVIEVRYQFVPHTSRNMSVHFALIPLGKLSAGKIRVNVVQSPLDQVLVDQYLVKPLRPEWGRQIVCKSFSFLVVDQKDN